MKRKETALKILITAPKGEIFDRHFPPEVIRRLESLGEVRLNPGTKQFTREELKKELSDIDIVMTHWGAAQYDAELLDSAPKLKILAHCAGTVAHIASEECYKRKIHVLSANSIMAKFVAEGVLGMIIAVMREFTFYDSSMRSGKWERRIPDCLTLIGSEIGFIGLGTVGRCLLDLLRPIGCRAKIYDPYIDFGALENYEFASPATFEEAMKCPVVTVHASQTPETYHIINEKALSMLPDGGVLINSSRGSLVDTNALINELSTDRIRAALPKLPNRQLPTALRPSKRPISAGVHSMCLSLRNGQSIRLIRSGSKPRPATSCSIRSGSATARSRNISESSSLRAPYLTMTSPTR